ncbi:hypothetical protein D3C71_1104650 [compost metagenome]
MQLEDLRQERPGHLGNPADRLPAHAPGPAQSRTTRLPARRQLFLVPVQRQPPEVPADPRHAAAPVARSAQDPGAGGCVGQHRGGQGKGALVQDPARHGRFRAAELGRGQRDHRGFQPVHREAVWAGPRGRILADSGDVDGVLRRRRALPVAAGRRLPFLLRLVLRSAAGLAADLGRADRRSRIGRLVQQPLHHRLGLERAADAYARCALLHRGALQRHQDGLDLPGLFRAGQADRSLAAPQAGHRRRVGVRLRPRDPARVPCGFAVAVLPGLLPPVLGHADAGASGASRGWTSGGRAFPARQ